MKAWLRALFVFFCLALAGTSFSPVTQARDYAITGGTCSVIDSQTEGIVLDSCTNLTDQTANDLHLNFSYPALPTQNLNYTQPFFQCSVFGVGDCFGSSVASGGVWEGIDGGTANIDNPVLWGVVTSGLTNFNYNSLTVSGYWTSNGTPIPAVPEPLTWEQLLAGMALIGLALRPRNRAFNPASAVVSS